MDVGHQIPDQGLQQQLPPLKKQRVSSALLFASKRSKRHATTLTDNSEEAHDQLQKDVSLEPYSCGAAPEEAATSQDTAVVSDLSPLNEPDLEPLRIDVKSLPIDWSLKRGITFLSPRPFDSVASLLRKQSSTTVFSSAVCFFSFPEHPLPPAFYHLLAGLEFSAESALPSSVKKEESNVSLKQLKQLVDLRKTSWKEALASAYHVVLSSPPLSDSDDPSSSLGKRLLCKKEESSEFLLPKTDPEESPVDTRSNGDHSAEQLPYFFCSGALRSAINLETSESDDQSTRWTSLITRHKALLCPSSPGLRKSLSDLSIDFSTPFMSVASIKSVTKIDGDILKELLSLPKSSVQLLEKESNPLDSTPFSVLLISGESSVEKFVQFLSDRKDPSSLAHEPPSIISPFPFLHGTLCTHQIVSDSISRALLSSSSSSSFPSSSLEPPPPSNSDDLLPVQHLYRMRIEGLLLPSATQRIVQLVSSSVGSFEVSLKEDLLSSRFNCPSFFSSSSSISEGLITKGGITKLFRPSRSSSSLTVFFSNE